MGKIDDSELKDLFIELRDTENPEIFEILYDKYSGLVYRIAFSILKNKEDSEDIVQVVFTKISTMAKDNLPLRSVSSWLYSVTKNEAISLLRRQKSIVDLDNIYDIEDTDDEVKSTIDRLEFNNLINSLNPKEQEIVSLKVLDEFSFEEIAGFLDEPTGTVKWRYYKSVYSLRLLLSNLSMFIISFIIGLKTLGIKDVEEQNESANEEGNVMINDRSGSILQFENNLEEGSIIIGNTREELQTTTELDEFGVNYWSVGFLTISGIFLFFTVFFSIIFIKHQLKGVFKSSK